VSASVVINRDTGEDARGAASGSGSGGGGAGGGGGGAFVGGDDPADRGGTLLGPPPPFPSGGTMLVVTVEKIGLKGAQQYLTPRIIVSWRGAGGARVLEEIQELPVSTVKREQFVEFNAEVYQQSSMEELAALEDAAIFFEFGHFKPKKDKVSIRCWSFLPLSAVKDGAIVLEIYEKPADYKCKKLKLLTSKPLYLHLRAKLVAH
jgi:hypothetical protein